jgi:recombination protein RecT
MNNIVTTKDLFSQDKVKSKFHELLGARAPSFITSVLQAVSSNAALKDADPHSVYHAAATAATLDLPINNNLGFAYIVPYRQWVDDGNGNQKQVSVAQFQLGYKGFIQLAQRSGQFKTISASPIYEGQLVEENPLTGFLFDFTKRPAEGTKVIGYAAYFRLLNGFEKTLYMPAETVGSHAKKYSKTYAKTGKGLWKDDFDGMAIKTVLKLLLSKFAPLSIEMQRGVITDQSVIKDSDTMDVDYVDNQNEIDQPEIDKEEERMRLMVNDCKSAKELTDLMEKYPDWPADLFTARAAELGNDKKEQAQADLARILHNKPIREKITKLEAQQEGVDSQDAKYLTLQEEIETLQKQLK